MRKISYLVLGYVVAVFDGLCEWSYSRSDSKGLKESGKASYYANEISKAKKTASGELFDQKSHHDGAHKRLPFGSKVKVGRTSAVMARASWWRVMGPWAVS